MKKRSRKWISMMITFAMIFGILQSSIIIPEEKALAVGSDAVRRNIDVTLSEWVLDEANGYIYAISQESSQLLFIRADTFDISESITLDSFPTDIKLYDNKIWIPLEKNKQVIEVDIATRSIINTYTLQNEPIKIELYNDTLFYTGAPNVPFYEQWSYVYAYDFSTNTETVVRSQGTWCPNLAIDRDNNILYVSDMYQVYSFSMSDYTQLSGTDHMLGFTYIKNRAHKMFYDGKNVYFAGKAFDPSNLSIINGTYRYTNEITYADKNAVYCVSNIYVVTNNAVYDRDTYTKIADLPFETTMSLMDSLGNIYLFDPTTNDLVREHLNPNYDFTSQTFWTSDALQLENSLREWVYDAAVNKIYAITENSNSILYIDAETMQVDGEKWIGSIPTDIELSGDTLYVALFGSTKVAVTGTNMSSPVETVVLQSVPYRIAVDNNKLYYVGQGRICYLHVYNFSDSTEMVMNLYFYPDLVADRANHIVYIGDSGSSGNKLTAISTVDNSVIGTTINQYDCPGKLSISGSDVYYQGGRYGLGIMDSSLGYYNKSIYGAHDQYVFTGDGIFDRDSHRRIITLPFTTAYQVLIGIDNAVYFYSDSVKTIVKYHDVEPYASSLNIFGNYEIEIPTTGTASSTYAAYVQDQYGNRISGMAATWSLVQPVNGVSIDQTTGKITVSSSAQPGTIVIRATADGASGLYALDIKKYTLSERRSYLSELVDLGNQFLNTGYPWRNLQYLQSAVNSAKAILQKSSPTITEINSAIYELEAQINRSYLEALVYEAEAQSQGNYSADRWAVLKIASENGRSVFTASNPPANDVIDAIIKLEFVLYTLPDFELMIETIEENIAVDDCTPKTRDFLKTALLEAHILQISPYWRYDDLNSIAEKMQGGVIFVGLDQYILWAQELIDEGSEAFESTTWDDLNNAYNNAVSVQEATDVLLEEAQSAYDALGMAVFTAEMELLMDSDAVPQSINCTVSDWENYQSAVEAANNLLENGNATPDELYEALLNIATALETIFTGAPHGLTSIAASSDSSSDGQIFGTTTLMEYKLSSDTTWTTAPDTVITDLPAGTYVMRYSAETGFEAGVEATVIVPSLNFSEPSDIQFDDVASEAWYSDAVKFAAERGITNGTGNNLFSPEQPITRGQFVVMLMRAYGIMPDATTNDNFADAGNTYYTNYLSVAKRLGISNGVGNNMFAPNDTISRQDMFTMLYRALKILNKLPMQINENSLSDYSDASKISSYALEALDSFVTCGIVTGSDGMLDPFGITSRAQMAQVFYRLLS